MNNVTQFARDTPNGPMSGYFASNPSEDSALMIALVVGGGIWLASYLWKQYNKPNRKLPPLENKEKSDK